MRPRLPDYGTFPRWPHEGHAWIHPEDVSVALRLIPSDRVFRRYRYDGLYYYYQYGERLRFRLRPAMWLALPWEGFDVDDQVEVIGIGMVREPMVARIAEMRFSKQSQRIEYTLERADRNYGRIHVSEEMRLLTTKVQLRRGDQGHPAPRWNPPEGEARLELE